MYRYTALLLTHECLCHLSVALIMFRNCSSSLLTHHKQLSSSLSFNRIAASPFEDASTVSGPMMIFRSPTRELCEHIYQRTFGGSYTFEWRSISLSHPETSLQTLQLPQYSIHRRLTPPPSGAGLEYIPGLLEVWLHNTAESADGGRSWFGHEWRVESDEVRGCHL